MSRFGIRTLSRELGCRPSALYHYVRSRQHLLAAVARLAAQRLTGAVRVAASGTVDKRADETVERAVGAFLRFASEDRNSWELLFLCPATSNIGRRTRLIIERRLASLLTQSGERIDERDALAAAAAKFALTVAMGEAAIRVCRPGHLGPELSAAQIVDLLRHQRSAA